MLELVIEILLYAIIYPLARELFAFQNDRCSITFNPNFTVEKHGPPSSEKGTCKNFFDHYNATPSLEAKTIAGSEALKWI
jgi:hypothetical protein